MRQLLVVLVVVGLAGTAHADANADVTKAFTTFIEGVAAKKAAMKGVDTFIPPGSDETSDEDGTVLPVPSDVDDVGSTIASPKLKVTKVMVSKSGKSAWLAGELPGSILRKKKIKKEPLRVSGFLANDGKAWQVTAIHFSTGEPDRKTDMCGARDDWRPKPSIPKALQPTVKDIMTALEGDYLSEGGVKTDKFVKLLSDDKNAVLIGSAPKEVFTGGAKIKGMFKKWKISSQSADGDTIYARGAQGPDGEMMWISTGIVAPVEFCTSYRTLFVLAKESAGWRIVHQHYSSSTNPY